MSCFKMYIFTRFIYIYNIDVFYNMFSANPKMLHR